MGRSMGPMATALAELGVVVKTQIPVFGNPPFDGIPFRGFRCTPHFGTYFSGWMGCSTGGTFDPWPNEDRKKRNPWLVLKGM